MERKCRRKASNCLLVTSDGSLAGWGATLQAGTEQFSDAHRKPFIAYWTGAWSDQDLERLQVKRGDPAGQARREAFTLLNSGYLWREVIQDSR